MNLNNKETILSCEWWKDATDDWWQEDESFRVYVLHHMLQQKNATKSFWNEREREYKDKSPLTRLTAIGESRNYLMRTLTLIELHQLKLDNLCRKWQSTGMSFMLSFKFCHEFVFTVYCL